jgi:hypothetical protein
MQPNAAAESVHPASADEAWQESVFLAWHDPIRRVGGLHRIGLEENRKTSNMWCGVFKEQGQCFRLNQEGVQFAKQTDGRAFICGPQRLLVEDDALRWSLETPECSMDIRMEDRRSGDLFGGNTAAMKAGTIADHYHMHCRVHGRVRLAEQTFEIDGSAWRDHSWGVRHWANIKHHVLSASFADDHAIDFYAILDARGALSRGGMIAQSGRKTTIDDFRLTVAIDDDGVTARNANVDGRLPSGEPFSAHFDLAGAVLVQTRGFMGVEAVGKVTLSSGETGFGYMAVSNNPRGGRLDPPLVINAISQNGLGVMDFEAARRKGLQRAHGRG